MKIFVEKGHGFGVKDAKQAVKQPVSLQGMRYNAIMTYNL